MYHFELKPFRQNWNPSELWEKEVEKIFNGMQLNQQTFTPACEVRDEDKSYFVGLDIPGLQKEDLDIEVKDNHLYISGERKSASEKTNVLRSERRYGKFSRTFTLPQNVKTEGIQATFENGVLEVVIPKEEKSQPRKIQISDWKQEAVQTDVKS